MIKRFTKEDRAKGVTSGDIIEGSIDLGDELPPTLDARASEWANPAPVKNTDRELWRERDGDYYADSIHVTESGGIGINCGGSVVVKSLREWFKLAAPPLPKQKRGRFSSP